MEDRLEQNEAAYTGFAHVYDELMDDVPYDDWARCYVELLRGAGIFDGLVCDLACGTGNMTLRLAAAGYDMIGVDNSEEMLDTARRKEGFENTLFLLQDMCEFELYGTVRAVTLACDSLNYLLSEEEVLSLFEKVNNYLDPGGLFIFDFNTDEKYESRIGNATIAENREDCSFIWENYYDPESRINECELTVFVRRENGLFERTGETHLQRGYRLDEIRALLEKAGLVFEKAMTMEEAQLPEDEGRILVVAREQGKEQNG